MSICGKGLLWAISPMAIDFLCFDKIRSKSSAAELLYEGKVLTLSHLQTHFYAIWKISTSQNIIIENIVKKENEQLLLLPKCFLKPSAANALKCIYRWKRVKLMERILVENSNFVESIYVFLKVNPFPHTTNLQQTTLKLLGKSTEKPFNPFPHIDAF